MASTSWSPARPSTSRPASSIRRSTTPTTSRCWRSPCRPSSRPRRRSSRGMKRTASVLVLLLALTQAQLPVLGGAYAAEPVPTPRKIFFATGSTRGTVGGHVQRGARDLYSLSASAGQVLTVTLTTPDDHAGLQIYEPA